jgi:hypothetical protein
MEPERTTPVKPPRSQPESALRSPRGYPGAFVLPGGDGWCREGHRCYPPDRPADLSVAMPGRYPDGMVSAPDDHELWEACVVQWLGWQVGEPARPLVQRPRGPRVAARLWLGARPIAVGQLDLLFRRAEAGIGHEPAAFIDGSGHAEIVGGDGVRMARCEISPAARRPSP